MPEDFTTSLANFATTCCNNSLPRDCNEDENIAVDLPDCSQKALEYIGARKHSTTGYVSFALGAVGIILNLLTICVLFKQKGKEGISTI